MPAYSKIFKTALLFFLATFLNAPLTLLSQSLPDGITLISTVQRNIYDITKGSDGFLWMGTQEGLFRYDGYRFLQFNNIPGNPNPISQNLVYRVLATNDGKLVVQNSFRTVDILDPNSRQLITIDIRKKTNPPADIRAVHQNATGEVFFITENNEGYALLQYSSGNFTKVWEVKERRPTNPLMTDILSFRFHLINEPDGSFLLHDRENGLLHLSAGGKSLRRFSPKEKIGQGEIINFLKRDMKGRTWMGIKDRKGLYRFDPQSGIMVLDERLPDNYFYLSSWEDKKGNLLFLASEDGKAPKAAYLLDAQEETIDFTKNLNLTASIHTIYSEDFQQLFFQATSVGLFKSTPPSVVVKNHLSDEENGIISMRGMAEDGQGNILVSTESKGWFLMDKATGELRHFPNEAFDHPELIPPISARNIVKDPQGYLWMSAYGEHKPPDFPHSFLIRYDGRTRSFKSFRCSHRIESHCLTKSGLLYLACTWSLQVFNPATGDFLKVSDQNGSDPLNGFAPNCIIQSGDGLLWIGTDLGLVCFDPRTNHSRYFSNYPVGNEDLPERSHAPFSGNHIYTILEDGQGSLLLGTNAGLNIFDPATGKVEIFTHKNGLADNQVCSILPDEQGNIWCATFNGLSYFDVKNRQFRNFFVTDGFNHNEFNRHASLRDSSGNYYFGGMNGFNSFRAENLLTQKNNPKILLSGLSFFDKKTDSLIIRYQNPSALQSVTLPADNRFLHAFFALDNLVHPELNRYAVFLEGYDPDWVSLGNVSEVRYNNLPPGQYRLLIKGFGPSGTPSANTIEVDVKVEQFFYKSTWFYLACLLLATGIVAGWIWRLRTEKTRLIVEVEKRTRQIAADKDTIEKQAFELQELDRMKSRFFANISHELRTPLTLILSPLNRILNNETLDKSTIRQHLELIKNNGEQLQDRIDELLELSRLIAGKAVFREQPVELLPLLRRTLARFGNMARQKGLSLSLNGDFAPQLQVLLDVPKFEKIIANLLGNAIKFTNAGEVRLEIRKLENSGIEAGSAQSSAPLFSQFQITVSDTGKGISPEDLPHIFDRYFQTKNSVPTEGGTGIGLAMAKEFTEMMGGKITVESEVGKGSTFTLVLPLKISENEAVENGYPTPAAFEKLSTIPVHRPPSTVHRETILLAEDNADLRNYLQSILRPHYKVIAVENGRLAWDYCQLPTADCQLILSDVMMPEMDGFTLLQKVKAEDRLRRIPFIMLTAKAGVESRLQALRTGVDDYLLKPFLEEELFARIENLLANQRLRLDFFKEEKNQPEPATTPPGWLEQLETLALDSLADPQMSMDFLAEKMGLSRSSLHRRIKAETGLSPNLYLREVRLQEARRLLENGDCASVAEASQIVGFQKRAYFSQLFAERFGRAPSAFF